jgi:DNA-binding transcriptional regulator YhcF (GntR family)
MSQQYDTSAPLRLPVDSIASRWGDAASAGFTPVPNTLMRAQAKLGLSPTEIVVLLNILLHWWERDRMPFPSTPAIAKRSGLSVRTVQRGLRSLEKKGLIGRVRARNEQNRNKRAHYDLDGLRDALAKFAVSDVWHRPNIVRQALAGPERRARTGLQNLTPEQP